MSPAGTSVSGADMAKELSHETLTEPHHFVVTLSLRIEIRAAFSTAHRERGQTVLEHLLESEELQDAEIHGWVKTETALYGPMALLN